MLVEVDYWVHKLLGPRTCQVLADDITRGAYRLEMFTIDDLQRAAEIDADIPVLTSASSMPR